eukprot:gb/GFBE01034695.1/.p1 GENE.gb/GFBE01034695.1/~~gb/GFBE01034695.1/.p1  ORF type:complete len:489 (+),score=77.78 gb/GFBE01034695.1/:1-1467(+)
MRPASRLMQVSPGSQTARTPRQGSRPKQLRAKVQIERLHKRLLQLWRDKGVPLWHQHLYTERYCTGDYRPEVLAREVKELSQGTALVQKVQDAIHQREEVLVRLTILRSGYVDEDFMCPGSLARRHLYEQLHMLRLATLNSVELMTSWRLSVAPTPGKNVDTSQTNAVAGPGSRGAAWPYAGPSGPFDEDDGTLAEGSDPEDYFLHLARDDTVVRSFETVLEVAEECDPFLFHGCVGGAGPNDGGKLCPPPSGSIDLCRLENARLKLLEQEMSLTLFLPPFKQGMPFNESLPEMSSLVKILTAPLALPQLPALPSRMAEAMSQDSEPLRPNTAPSKMESEAEIEDEVLNMPALELPRSSVRTGPRLSVLVPFESRQRPSLFAAYDGNQHAALLEETADFCTTSPRVTLSVNTRQRGRKTVKRYQTGFLSSASRSKMLHGAHVKRYSQANDSVLSRNSGSGDLFEGFCADSRPSTCVLEGLSSAFRKFV